MNYLAVVWNQHLTIWDIRARLAQMVTHCLQVVFFWVCVCVCVHVLLSLFLYYYYLSLFISVCFTTCLQMFCEKLTLVKSQLALCNPQLSANQRNAADCNFQPARDLLWVTTWQTADGQKIHCWFRTQIRFLWITSVSGCIMKRCSHKMDSCFSYSYA